MSKYELKRETSGPSEGDVGPFWASSASRRQNVGPSGAPATCHMCQIVPAHCHMLQKSSSLPWVASCPSKPSSHLQGAIPPRSNLCQSVLVRASFCLLHARAHHDVVLPLPSQQPSDGLFSPMEVRANHLPMCTGPLVPVRRVWSCTSKTTPSMGSSVLEIIAM
jgi:hypothetical protein